MKREAEVAFVKSELEIEEGEEKDADLQKRIQQSIRSANFSPRSEW